MSTSPETSQNRLPSNNPFEPAWRRKAARLALAVSPAVLLAVAVFSPVGDLIARKAAEAVQYREQRRALDPLIEQAKLWPVDYETAREGDYVIWRATNTSGASGFYAGKPMHPLVINNAPRYGFQDADILAQVERRTPQGVVIRYIARL